MATTAVHGKVQLAIPVEVRRNDREWASVRVVLHMRSKCAIPVAEEDRNRVATKADKVSSGKSDVAIRVEVPDRHLSWLCGGLVVHKGLKRAIPLAVQDRDRTASLVADDQVQLSVIIEIAGGQPTALWDGGI